MDINQAKETRKRHRLLREYTDTIIKSKKFQQEHSELTKGLFHSSSESEDLADPDKIEFTLKYDLKLDKEGKVSLITETEDPWLKTLDTNPPHVLLTTKLPTAPSYSPTLLTDIKSILLETETLRMALTRLRGPVSKPQNFKKNVRKGSNPPPTIATSPPKSYFLLCELISLLTGLGFDDIYDWALSDIVSRQHLINSET